MRVLVVEDDLSLSDVIAFTLRRAGFEILTAYDGMAALATWEQQTGYMDGEEFADVDYRLANVEEDIGEVEELIEALGESFSVKRLPKWKPRAKAS